MKKTLSFVFLVLHFGRSLPQTGRTALEIFLPIARAANLFSKEITIQLQQRNASPLRKAKFQNLVSESEPFPCNLTHARSLTKPSSVHKLRPGDIDVIAAIGDSLTAGIGIQAINLLELPLEDRGKSFTIGGEGDWRKYTTLPNILKVFNPNLVGYSLKTSTTLQEGSQLNFAEGFAISSDMPFMASQLIKRIKLNKGIVNVDENWKMITIFIGSNDFCAHLCYLQDPYSSLKKYRKNMIQTLRLLRDNLPKTFVNVIPAPHMRILVDLKQTDPACHLSHLFECPCFFGAQFENKRNVLYDIMSRWQKIDLEIGNLEEFDRDDFTLVVQPFTLNYTFPASTGNVADLRFFSSDCFHFSQRMHARIANDLWNNILEPVGKKALDGSDLFKKFRCPSEQNPFIYTRRNS